MKPQTLTLLGLLTVALLATTSVRLTADETLSLFDHKNISALWIAAPWDAKKRGPEERMQMLKELGLSKFAYNGDGAVDSEIEAAKKHGIEIAAFWYPVRNPQVVEAIKRYGIHPQFWVCGSRAITVANEAERIEAEVARIRPIAEDAAALGCKVGLYNHREPWFEEQDHQIAIIERLRRDGLTNVGIVFNFHHWRGSLAEFPALFKRIQPHLLAVNLNGMRADTAQYPPVRYIGSDESELEMIRVVQESGWRGPIGVIHERPTVDAAEGIKGNLQGLAWVQRELQQPGSGGPKPQEPAPPKPVLPKPVFAPLAAPQAADDARLAVQSADDARIAAMSSPERSRLTAIFSDELRYAHSTGAVDTKASFIDTLTSGKTKYLRFEYLEREFSFPAPGIALMTGRVRIRVATAEGEMENSLSFLAVWRKEKDHWRFLAWQSCKLPTASKP